jgi:hypothetical protein
MALDISPQKQGQQRTEFAKRRQQRRDLLPSLRDSDTGIPDRPTAYAVG